MRSCIRIYYSSVS